MSIRKFLKRISSANPKAQSITRIEDRFRIDEGNRTQELQLSNIASISGTKVDKVTFDENYLVLTSVSGEKVSVGELAEGFAELDQALCAMLLDFPKHWRTRVETMQAGESIDLWVK